ncbi:LuxE/PaaK family acyltransferase [Psychroflexus salis]|uniref:Acyltransferase n=1 Tax=Psychroflexus salis TaxID=1526574 RepID=A0A916ZVB4_9FLAO|nr:acyl transferase [Psychroflexus salis]GGE14425.1 acyltransferase [Psychroflexus salis]
MNPANIDINHLIQPEDFLNQSLNVFAFQYENNLFYRKFCNLLHKTPANVSSLEEIPFLPIQFFKSHKIYSSSNTPQITFKSSGTTGSITSKHQIADLSLYEKSYFNAFETEYGNIEDYLVLGLLPSYLERSGSSLIYMVNSFIERSKFNESGFYLDNLDALKQTLEKFDGKRKILLIGVSFALLDFAERFQLKLNSTTVMETGGMKGRRKELIREELHVQLKQGFGVQQIHSEYGMTELLSQSYSTGDGIFKCPTSMKILIRDTENPLHILNKQKTGGINIIDLANLYSVSFIATQDLGRQVADNEYEILGRFDHSDVRGCNLMFF